MFFCAWMVYINIIAYDLSISSNPLQEIFKFVGPDFFITIQIDFMEQYFKIFSQIITFLFECCYCFVTYINIKTLFLIVYYNSYLLKSVKFTRYLQTSVSTKQIYVPSLSTSTGVTSTVSTMVCIPAALFSNYSMKCSCSLWLNLVLLQDCSSPISCPFSSKTISSSSVLGSSLASSANKLIQ